MRTPEEIIKLYPGLKGLRLNDIEQASLEMAMKEYSKQWIDRALESAFDIDNFNRGIIYKDLENVKNEIDAQ